MPRNNSKAAKDARYRAAVRRSLTRTLRDCGHQHTDKGWEHCRAKFFKEIYD